MPRLDTAVGPRSRVELPATGFEPALKERLWMGGERDGRMRFSWCTNNGKGRRGRRHEGGSLSPPPPALTLARSLALCTYSERLTTLACSPQVVHRSKLYTNKRPFVCVPASIIAGRCHCRTRLERNRTGEKKKSPWHY